MKATYIKAKAIRILSHVFTLITSTVLILSAIDKWVHFQQYLEEVRLHPLPGWITASAPWVLPPLFVGLALALVPFKLRRYVYFAVLFLWVGFTAYMLGIINGWIKPVPCNCTGLWHEGLGWDTQFWLVLLLAGIAIAGLQATEYSKRLIKTS